MFQTFHLSIRRARAMQRKFVFSRSEEEVVGRGLKTSLERYAIIRLIVVEGDPLYLKYYPWILPLFIFSSLLLPLGPPSKMKYGGPRGRAASTLDVVVLDFSSPSPVQVF